MRDAETTDLFPGDFLWGAATSAYQIEGHPLADGAGASIWHRFSHTPGKTAGGETGDLVCEHYRLWAEDIDLAAALGLNAYRFSLAWGRILPAGTGAVNERGLDFYERLVDRLLARGLTPMATLYHWDLPAALDDRGGWLNRDVAGWFADYARTVGRRLGDRVPLWTTLNEPWVVADAGYLHGVHAPGHANLFEAPLAAHHLLLAHGAGADALRSVTRGQVGIVVNLAPKDPASTRPEDAAAAARDHVYMNRAYLDPLFLGSYPEELAALFGEAWPSIPAADLARIRRPLDFLGINYYTRAVVADAPAGAWGHEALPPRVRPVRQADRSHTALGWEVNPDGLLRILRWVRSSYGEVPLYVTENGAAFYDPPSVPEGGLRDPLRVDYYRGHLRAARAARADGVDLRGYFAWSLLDNYEWAAGTAMRFGIVHVDYATQVRTPKESARFYSEVIRTRGRTLDPEQPPRPTD